MGADGVMSVSVSRGGAMASPDVPSLHQCLSLEHISFGTRKYTRSGELRRALGVSLGSTSEDLPVRASNFRPSPPVATEELKQIRESVLNASIKARARAEMFCDSLNKLEKYYRDTMVSKKRQRAEFLSNDKPSGSSLLKMAGQPRNLADQSAQRLEDRAKSSGMNKRFRTSATELRVDNKSGSLSKDQMITENINIIKTANGTSIPEERTLRLSAVGDCWDKNMMKRKRSVGTVSNRSADNDIKRTVNSEPCTDSKLATYDNSLRLSGRSNAKQGTSTGTPAAVIKGKISRAPRTGSVMAVNSSSDVQASSEGCEGWEQPTSTNKVISLDLMQNSHRAASSSYMLGQWVGQRQQKSSRSRRTNVVSPVSNNDEGQISTVKLSPVIGAKFSQNGSVGCLESVDSHNNNLKSKIKVESMPSPGLISEGEDSKDLELKLEEKGTDCSDVVLTGKGKMRSFIFPTKRNKNVPIENVGDGMRRQGRTVRGLSLSSPGLSPPEPKLENVSTAKRIQSTRPGSEKIKSKSGRPPSKKMSDGRAFARNFEANDDREELLLAAAAARKASHICCSGRFWKKMEPIFGTASSQDVRYIKQQLSLAEELPDSLSVIPGAQYNIMGVFMRKEKADVSSGNKVCDSNQIVDKDESLSGELFGEKRSDKFSSLYQRVLSALIEEDDSEGIYNGNEGVSMSLQCASDDSHCGSCNYVDADIRDRDRDRFDSEAESMVDFQIQKRCSGDRISCNKSVTSNTTRNGSMSDSLYSSGRWLGDDGFSHSDAEFVSGNWHNDVSGSQPSDMTASATFLDPQYQLMCVDDKLMLELQSIGLYLDAMPDLADGEVIDRDITELNEGLCEQIGKKKNNLVKIDKAVEDDREREKRFIEQVAMEQLIQMAYKRRMACRRNNASKTVMRKVSKQVAMGFIERTLVRCKKFELTGRSCFSDPALQNVLFAAPHTNDAGSSIATDYYTGHGAPKCRVDSAKAEFNSFSVLDSCTDDFGRGYIDSLKAAGRSSVRSFPELESLSHKGKKRELLLDDVGGTSRGAIAFGSSVIGGAKAKRSERDRDHSRGVLMATAAGENQSVVSFSTDQKPKTKPKNLTSSMKPTSSLEQWKNTENKRGRELGLSGNAPEDACQESEEHIDFESIEQLDIPNDPNAPEDFSNWLTGLQDYDSIGLEIPMDDLNMVVM
ncbi:uncharacterized protein LOC110684251 isoform X2 [Chenopodium quinoa]|uniref:uncharacterized protein LOC110684251 isoform X2 n=1 Tax=Chenopodium quinoa TaxID=63459 RepID=UPI000B78F35E|nr:uncharacterized protein LOC110684251 isoform X2 [Chenopodium quinoa]